TIFGPKPHRYDIKLNRKVKQLALMSALSYKAKENAILVVEDLKMDVPKTKAASAILADLQINNKKSLFVLPDFDENVHLSFRNIPGVESALFNDINTYDVMNADVLVFTENTAKNFSEDVVAEEA